MKKLFFVCSTCILLTACGNPNQVYGLGLVPQSVTGDENGVSVFNVWDAGAAQPLASRHCREYDKEAIFQRMQAISAVFTCE
ncbi:hypothetical protein THS5294_01537 [Thalassobacter stenotrophicus]|uniref:Lipoprotein n=3 Tax=Thalassobacter stenotrophicus TaxID=266809 RepID=A0A0P1FF39_9RHOB|nr:hypothetical protein THS5294_01537 [Thalassobacter stenotrophicus]SHI71185.1 hypothetical protein SAMN02744035_01329 [Thalassobacter stenotrophicus DSM 16310]